MTDFRNGLIATAMIVGMTALAPMAAQSQTSAQPPMQKSQMQPGMKMQSGMKMDSKSHAKMHASHQTTMLQEKLNASGAGLKVDGRMGPKTRAALASFQRSHGLKATGRMDDKTRQALMKA